MKNILVESNFSNIVTEAVGAGDTKKLYISGVFLESESPNGNGRSYRKKDITEAADMVMSKANEGRHLLGELDHPMPSTLVVRLDNVSHKIVEMHMDGNNAIGKAEILPTPKGLIAKALIEAGVTIGVSSRGHGDIIEDRNGNGDIVEGFKLVTVDLVAVPSANEAYPTSIYEHLNMYGRGKIVNEIAEAVRYDKAAQAYFSKEIIRFIKEKFNK